MAPMHPVHRHHRSADIRSELKPVEFKPLVAVQAAVSSDSFGEFMAHLRNKQGDAVYFDLWPFAPKTYLLMGKEANRDILSSLDPGLEQILQELINVLPVSAKVPSEVDVPLQRKVASLFQSESVVNERLPSFGASSDQDRPVSSLCAFSQARSASMSMGRVSVVRTFGTGRGVN